MSLSETQRNSLFQRALKLCNDKQFEHALSLFRQLTIEAPDFALPFTELGLLLEKKGDLRAAAVHLEQAVKIARQNVNCLWALADFYRRHGELQKARQCFGYAAELAPSNPSLFKGLLNVQRALEDHAGALLTLERILVLEPDNAAASAARGEMLEKVGRLHDALVQFEAVLNRANAPAYAIERWANLMIKLDRTNELIDWLEKRFAKASTDVRLLLLLSVAYVNAGRHVPAMEVLEKAYGLQPENIRIPYDLGVISGSLGRFEEAQQWFLRILQRNPRHAYTLRLFGNEHTYTAGDEAFVRLESAFSQIESVSLEERAQLFFALAKAYNDVGDYAKAFHCYDEGGKAYLSTHPPFAHWFDDYTKLVDQIFSREIFDSPPEPGCKSEKPIFVLGMPRSGTSLVEQMLSSHPDVFGAGEVGYLERALDGMSVGKNTFHINTENPFFSGDHVPSYEERGKKYLEALSLFAPAEARRIVDKMPQNFWRTGFIKLILPDAKIIHCRRHPVETCLSAYQNFFVSGHLYSFDLRELGNYYRCYDEIMSVWRARMPQDSFLDVRYEDVVLNFEEQARRLLRFVGLEWNDNCVNFHLNPRAVHTASAAQVRKPLYKTSMKRWRKYEAHIKPLLDELGPLVRQYESELEESATNDSISAEQRQS